MSDTLKSGNRPPIPPSRKADPFELPRLIAQKLKKCAEDRRNGGPEEAAKFLWVNLSANCTERPARTLSLDEWLNVVDEAATLGVRVMVVCTGDSFNACPGVLEMCQWAQDAHDMTVGFHVQASTIEDGVLKELAEMAGGKTWFFVNRENTAAHDYLVQRGFNVCDADVIHDEPAGGCDGPKNLLFVGPQGKVYCCGVMLNNEEFNLGHVLDEPLESVLRNPDKLRQVPKGYERPAHGCDGCPNRMDERMT